MRRFLLIAAAAFSLSACDFFTQSIDIDIDDHGGGGSATPAPVPASCASAAVTCKRVELAGGHASAFTISHSCGLASVVCMRGDGLGASFSGVASGAELDPGDPGIGGGDWTCQITGGGSCSVSLDS